MERNEPLIYIVDDDAAVCDSLTLLLKSVKLKAQAYRSAAEFLEHYDPEQHACLVADIRMPGMSGLELQAVLDQNQIVFNRSSIGRKMAVLLDRPGRKAGQFAGRSVYMQPVHVDAPARYFGRIAELEITDAHANSLSARLAGEEGGNGSHMERAFA